MREVKESWPWIDACPHHGLDKWLLVDSFHRGLLPESRRRVDNAALGRIEPSRALESSVLLYFLSVVLFFFIFTMGIIINSTWPKGCTSFWYVTFINYHINTWIFKSDSILIHINTNSMKKETPRKKKGTWTYFKRNYWWYWIRLEMLSTNVIVFKCQVPKWWTTLNLNTVYDKTPI